jgi:hypothetical protein
VNGGVSIGVVCEAPVAVCALDLRGGGRSDQRSTPLAPAEGTPSLGSTGTSR